MSESPNRKMRVEHAPFGGNPYETHARPLSVAVAEDEDVAWIFTTLPDGIRYASGFTIVKKSGLTDSGG